MVWMDDFEKQLKEDRFQNLLDYLKNFPTPKEFNLDISYIHVINLLDFMELIEANSNQLKTPHNLECIKKGIKPSAFLVDYIILEISSFYTNIYLMKKKGKFFPELPNYWKELKDYRDIMPGHRDKEHKLKTLADHTSLIKKLDSLGIPKIVDDFIKYYALMKKQIP
jgi:hypothetical protein